LCAQDIRTDGQDEFCISQNLFAKDGYNKVGNVCHIDQPFPKSWLIFPEASTTYGLLDLKFLMHREEIKTLLSNFIYNNIKWKNDRFSCTEI